MIQAKTNKQTQQKIKNLNKKSNPKKLHMSSKDKMKQRGQCHNEQFATENLH